MDNQELIRLLKKTNKMSNKYLAKRISVREGRNIREQKTINTKIYELLMSLFNSESREKLVTLNAIIKLISDRICKSSGWIVMGDLSFCDETGKFQVVRTDTGYTTVNDSYKEIDFLDKYGSSLSVIHDTLIEQEEFLAGSYSLKEKTNESLARELITYLNDNLYGNICNIKDIEYKKK